MHPDTEEQSSHALLDYSRWTLLSVGAIPPDSPLSPDRLRADRLKHVAIESLAISAAGRESLLSSLNLDSESALLIRPDGHVALKLKSPLAPSDEKEASASTKQLEEKLGFLGIKSGMGHGERNAVSIAS